MENRPLYNHNQPSSYEQQPPQQQKLSNNIQKRRKNSLSRHRLQLLYTSDVGVSQKEDHFLTPGFIPRQISPVPHLYFEASKTSIINSLPRKNSIDEGVFPAQNMMMQAHTLNQSSSTERSFIERKRKISSIANQQQPQQQQSIQSQVLLPQIIEDTIKNRNINNQMKVYPISNQSLNKSRELLQALLHRRKNNFTTMDKTMNRNNSLLQIQSSFRQKHDSDLMKQIQDYITNNQNFSIAQTSNTSAAAVVPLQVGNAKSMNFFQSQKQQHQNQQQQRIILEKKNVKVSLKNSQEAMASETDSNHISHRKKQYGSKLLQQQQLRSLENIQSEDYGVTTPEISIVEASKQHESMRENQEFKVTDFVTKTRNPLLIASRKTIQGKSLVRVYKKITASSVEKSIDQHVSQSPPFKIRILQPQSPPIIIMSGDIQENKNGVLFQQQQILDSDTKKYLYIENEKQKQEMRPFETLNNFISGGLQVDITQKNKSVMKSESTQKVTMENETPEASQVPILKYVQQMTNQKLLMPIFRKQNLIEQYKQRIPIQEWTSQTEVDLTSALRPAVQVTKLRSPLMQKQHQHPLIIRNDQIISKKIEEIISPSKTTYQEQATSPSNQSEADTQNYHSLKDIIIQDYQSIIGGRNISQTSLATKTPANNSNKQYMLVMEKKKRSIEFQKYIEDVQHNLFNKNGVGKEQHQQQQQKGSRNFPLISISGSQLQSIRSTQRKLSPSKIGVPSSEYYQQTKS